MRWGGSVFHVNAYRRLTEEGLPIAVIQPGLGSIYTRTEMSFVLGLISSRDDKIFILHECFHPGIPEQKSSLQN